jgi:cytochrome c-type biogenesis protein
LAGTAETVTRGVLLLWVYSLGLAVPFLLTSVLIDRFLIFYSRFRRHLHTLEVISGGVMMVLGVLILTRRFTVLSSYLGFLNRFTW